jgi:hypothetical protein
VIVTTAEVRLNVATIEKLCVETNDDGLFSMIMYIVYIIVVAMVCHITGFDLCIDIDCQFGT